MMTPKHPHPIIKLVDGLDAGQSAIVSRHDYDGYTSLRILLDRYYQKTPTRKKFKVTMISQHPASWQIERVQ